MKSFSDTKEPPGSMRVVPGEEYQHLIETNLALAKAVEELTQRLKETPPSKETEDE